MHLDVIMRHQHIYVLLKTAAKEDMCTSLVFEQFGQWGEEVVSYLDIPAKRSEDEYYGKKLNATGGRELVQLFRDRTQKSSWTKSRDSLDLAPSIDILNDYRDIQNAIH